MGKRFTAIAILFLIGIYSQSAIALSSEQVLALKKAGVEDKTIHIMIQQEMAAKNIPPDHGFTREIKVRDGNTSIQYSTGSRPIHHDAAEQEKLDKAWNMLQHIIIDGRKQ
jgi:hypothetical protein